MEEYKKEIKIILDTIRGILQKDVKPTDEDVYSIDGKQFLAIEQLLKRVEELELKCKQKNKTINTIRFIEAITRGQENIILFDEEKCVIKNKYMIEVFNGEFVDVNELYSIWKNNISKTRIANEIKELDKKEKQELKGLKGQDRYFIKQMYQSKKSVLQKLLEEK